MDAIRFDPESTSVILRATDIVEVIVESARTSEWRRVSGRLQQRDLDLTLRRMQVFKGEADMPPGAVFAVHAVQSTPAIPRFFAVPGVWSGYDPALGDRFIIFSVAGEPIRVQPAETAAEDVRRALRAGAPELSLGATMTSSEGDLENWGFLFANYLEARIPECFYEGLSDFRIYLRIIEDPRLSAVARNILLPAAYTKLMVYDPAPPVFIALLLAATARLLATPYGAPFREAVLDTYMPNLLGITGGLEPKSAAEALDAAAADRETIQSFVSGLGTEPILAWMRS